MALSADQSFSFLLILILFLGLSHALAYIFERFKQPRVIGEILAGCLLGATGLAHLAPETYSLLFKISAPALGAMGGFQELGLLLLMFCSGFEVTMLSQGKELKQSLWLAFVGLSIPLIAAFFLVDLFDMDAMMGSIKDTDSLRIIFMLAMAVTSIPVISRILADLQLLGTKFARVVLSVALIEDLVLYGILSALLAKHSIGSGADWGLKATLGIAKGTWADFVANFAMVLVLFGFALWGGPALFRKVKKMRINFLFKGNQSAFILVFMLTLVLCANLLGVAAIFAAFIAGMIVGRDKKHLDSSLANIRNFSFATFIPLYFAGVGFSLDLYSGIDGMQFVLFFGLSSLVKISSIFFASWISKQSFKLSWAYGFALNARGGPGIVLATICYHADLISKPFFGTLILTAIVTSLISGAFLDRAKSTLQ